MRLNSHLSDTDRCEILSHFTKSLLSTIANILTISVSSSVAHSHPHLLSTLLLICSPRTSISGSSLSLITLLALIAITISFVNILCLNDVAKR